MNIKNTLYIIVYIAVLTACSGTNSGEGTGNGERTLEGSPDGKVLAEVNGESITQPLLLAFATSRGIDLSDPTQPARALDALIETVLLAQEARQSGLADQPEVRAGKVLAAVGFLAARSVADFRSRIDISDAELKAYYEREMLRTGGVELQLQHLLFAQEAEAMAAVERALAAGADFEQLVGEYAAQGALQARDLGWANLGQLPPELAEAAKQMTDGQVAPLPIQTRFGWHVLRRAGSRPFAAPPFEQVRDGARAQLVDQALADQIKALREKATISVPTAATDQGS